MAHVLVLGLHLHTCGDLKDTSHMTLIGDKTITKCSPF